MKTGYFFDNEQRLRVRSAIIQAINKSKQDNDTKTRLKLVRIVHILDDPSATDLDLDRLEGIPELEEQEEQEKPYKEPYVRPYDRCKAAVYATGNKWAIENFNATH